ncbi:MAG: hypothetical protein BIFFINMI_01161 [Phycisphaerae bacterium]|nr:hypothetical protein [Phycisphaerae bacterium]
MRLAIASMLIAATFVSSASAAGLDARQVPATAKWVAHVDVTRLVASRLGQFVIDKGKAVGLEEKLAEVRNALGCDLLTDVKGLTLFGDSYDEKAWVLLLDAKMDQRKVTRIIEASEGPETLAVGDYTVHRWIDAKAKAQGKPAVRFGCFHGDSQAVIAADPDSLKAALLTLDAKAPSVAADDARVKSLTAADGAILYMDASDVAAAAKDRPRAGVLTNVRHVSLRVSEVDADLACDIALTAADLEHAQRFAKVLQGLIAMVEIGIEQKQADGQPVRPGEQLVADMLGKVKVAQDGPTVTIKGAFPVDAVSRLLFEIGVERRGGPATQPDARDGQGKGGSSGGTGARLELHLPLDLNP